MKISCLKSGDISIPALFRPFALKMEEQGMPPIVINIFKCYYSQLLYGAQGKLTEHDIEPVDENGIKHYAELDGYEADGAKAMSKVVIIKLNGGLGTSMGLEKAKSLIPVKDGLSFLDFIILQVKRLREKFATPLPLALMNSFKTHMDTMLRVEGFDNTGTGIPLSFVQHRYPKILEKTYAPASWPKNPELEWNPPGHGDIYTAMVTSGLLKKLLSKGYDYAFISNSDNLGAIMDQRLLGYMARENLPFLMEVAERTELDRKGGHLAKLQKTGGLVLREVAQCPENEIESFQDVKRYRFFNTNSLWLNLRAMEDVFVANCMMPLDMIINAKTLDPRDSQSPTVLQVETAMGAAISAFENARAICVPRTRFAPVKTTSDLLLVMSDCYHRTPDQTIEPNPGRGFPMPKIDLDPKYYKRIDDFLERFADGAPSLINCSSLSVKGDVRFGNGVIINGDVQITNSGFQQKSIAPCSTLKGSIEF